MMGCHSEDDEREDDTTPGTQWPPYSAPLWIDVADMVRLRNEATPGAGVVEALADLRDLLPRGSRWRRHNGQGHPWGGVVVSTARWSATYVPVPVRPVMPAFEPTLADLPF
jgi:hypothetical protein